MWNPCSSPSARSQDCEDHLPGANRTPLLLWLLWALSVVGAAGWVWWGAASAGQPIDIIFLVVRCTLVGLAGLLLLTLIEIRLAPWHFLD